VLLTHLPITNLYHAVISTDKVHDTVTVRAKAGGITIGEAMEGRVEPWATDGAISFTNLLCGGYKVALLSKTADEVTGLEMLAILSSKCDELDPVKFIHDKIGRSAFALNRRQ
jgi:hypothetical protein